MPSYYDEWAAPAEPPPPAECDCLRCGLTIDTRDADYARMHDGFVCSGCEEFGGSKDHDGLWRVQCELCSEWVHPSELVELLNEDRACLRHPSAIWKRAADQAISGIINAINGITALGYEPASQMYSACLDKKMSCTETSKPEYRSTFEGRLWGLLSDITFHHAASLNRDVFDYVTGDTKPGAGWSGLQPVRPWEEVLAEAEAAEEVGSCPSSCRGRSYPDHLPLRSEGSTEGSRGSTRESVRPSSQAMLRARSSGECLPGRPGAAW